MMNYIAERAELVDASGIRRIWQLAVNMTDPVDFSIGEPDFDAPEPVRKAAIDAINQGHNGYTLTTGLEPLRDSIAREISSQYNWSNPSILITCGVSGGLNLALMSTVNAQDEVLIPDPYFVMYKHLVNLYDGKCVFIDTYPDFQLDPDKLAQQITPRTKLLVLSSPANPTGAIYTADELKAIAALARKHNLLVISDEIYRDFSYDSPAPSLASYYENTLVMRGFSKAYGIPGWRLGYVALPEHLSELFDRMATLQQYTFVCAPHPFQIAALTALKSDISDCIDNYRHKRDLIYNGLKDSFNLAKPQGAFYAFVAAPGGKAGDFVNRAIQNNVLVIPGSVFSQKDTHFRISYATSDEQINKGIDRLCSLV